MCARVCILHSFRFWIKDRHKSDADDDSASDDEVKMSVCVREREREREKEKEERGNLTKTHRAKAERLGYGQLSLTG